MKPSFPIVQVIILADASLVRLAWEALLKQHWPYGARALTPLTFVFCL